MTKDPLYRWVYFFGGMTRPLQTLIEDVSVIQANLYQVGTTVSIQDVAVAQLPKDSWVLRLELPQPLSPEQRSGFRGWATCELVGVTHHLHYTSKDQRQELAAISAPELPASESTLAVLIPIRKSSAWWSLAHNERLAHFSSGDGHVPIGSKFAASIFRRLYHSRYVESAAGYDFLTYFEFPENRSAEFQQLLMELRDRNGNPEWRYVEAESEIWMRKKSL